MLRVALVCDLAEENWTSMNLVGDMLFEHLEQFHRDTIRANRIQPAFKRRVTAFGSFRPSRFAWKCDLLWNRRVEYSRWLRRRSHDYDIFHILDQSYAHLALSLPRDRTVITCHDLDVFRCLLEPTREPRPLWFRTMTQGTLKGLQSAQHVIFVSESIRREAEGLALSSNPGSSVIHNGAQYDSVPGQDEANDLLGSERGELLLLSVGSTVPRKRMDVLLRVFAGVVKEFPGARLVRVGGPLSETQLDLARHLNVIQSIVELPFVNRTALNAVYERGALLLQTSEAEGFGLPVAEAMARGCPVVASDLPVLREVGGHAATYCTDGDISGWIETVTRLLRQRCSDPIFWSHLRSRSIENASRFSWRENAEKTVSVYQRVIASSTGNSHCSSSSRAMTSKVDEVSSHCDQARAVDLCPAK